MEECPSLMNVSSHQTKPIARNNEQSQSIPSFQEPNTNDLSNNPFGSESPSPDPATFIDPFSRKPALMSPSSFTVSDSPSICNDGKASAKSQ
ncbi:unnamed protein product [Protopolystoma xenopodis]|uniref:Uncharacterized protein n=1 Tax=Protopolystoma xenopodis TaxID=117903 RepID=A0A448WIS0_9PLAT|nr:unnamed protein product [Protopolystoma xenopodis]